MGDNSSANKRIAKNSIFLSVRMVFVMCIMLYTTRLVLKVLGIEDYGVYNVVCGFVSLFVFLNTSMSNGIQRFYNYELGKNGVEGANNVYITSLNIQLLLAIIVILLTESIGLWYLYTKMVIPESRFIAATWIFHLSVLNFFFVIIQAPYTAAVMAHERMDFFAIVSVLDAVLKLVILYVIIKLPGDKLIWYGILMTLISVLNFILYFCYCKKNFSEMVFRRRKNRTLLSSMLGFSGWNLFGSFSILALEQGINLVLNFFYGPIVNAARGVASQVNGGLQNFVSTITTPVRPQVVQSYAQNDISRTMNLTYSISKLSSYFLMAMAIPVSLEIDYILHLWLGDNVPLHTSWFTIIILIVSLVNNLNSATSGVVHATGIMKNYQLIGSFIRLCAVPLSLALLYFIDIPEIALITVLVCASLAHFAGLFVVRNLVGMSLRDYMVKVLKPIILVAIISIIISTPLHFMIEKGLFRLLLVVIISPVVVFITGYKFGLNSAERDIVNKLLKRIKNKIVQ